jgi:hypothetical protein
MMTERIDFIAELLRESELAEQETKIEMDRLRADQLLAAVAVLEEQMASANDLVDKEVRLLEEYRSNELNRLDKQRSWLLHNLEAFARSSGEKTMRLPHGILKMRKGREKVSVVQMEAFLKVAGKLGLVRSVPESITPDNQAILNRIKATGDIPPGVEYFPAETRFSYIIKGETDGERNERNGDEAEG